MEAKVLGIFLTYASVGLPLRKSPPSVDSARVVGARHWTTDRESCFAIAVFQTPNRAAVAKERALSPRAGAAASVGADDEAA